MYDGYLVTPPCCSDSGHDSWRELSQNATIKKEFFFLAHGLESQFAGCMSQSLLSFVFCVSTVTAHTELNWYMTDSISGYRHLIWDFVPSVHVEEVHKLSYRCLREHCSPHHLRSSLRDPVLTARLCCISGETYCHANPNMMFVFGLNQSTSLGSL